MKNNNRHSSWVNARQRAVDQVNRSAMYGKRSSGSSAIGQGGGSGFPANQGISSSQADGHHRDHGIAQGGGRRGADLNPQQTVNSVVNKLLRGEGGPGLGGQRGGHGHSGLRDDIHGSGHPNQGAGFTNNGRAQVQGGSGKPGTSGSSHGTRGGGGDHYPHSHGSHGQGGSHNRESLPSKPQTAYDRDGNKRRSPSDANHGRGGNTNSSNSTSLGQGLIQQPVPPSDLTTIFVFDDSTGLRRDFKVGATLLLQHMRYFGSYLGSADLSSDDIEISVHCDIGIFSCLVDYMKSPTTWAEENLSSHNVIAVPLRYFIALRPCRRSLPSQLS